MTQNKLLFPNCDDEDIFSIDGDLYKVNRLRQAFKDATSSELINPIFSSLQSQKINVGWFSDKGHQSFHKWIDQAGQGCKLLSLGNAAWVDIALRFAAIASFFPENSNSSYILRVNLGNVDDVLYFADDRLYKIIKVNQALEQNEIIAANTFSKLLTQTLRISNEEIETISEWFTTGKYCEYLKVGASSWQKGIIKVGFYIGAVDQQGEFEAMELIEKILSQVSESPLDSIRKSSLDGIHNW